MTDVACDSGSRAHIGHAIIERLFQGPVVFGVVLVELDLLVIVREVLQNELGRSGPVEVRILVYDLGHEYGPVIPVPRLSAPGVEYGLVDEHGGILHGLDRSAADENVRIEVKALLA